MSQKTKKSKKSSKPKLTPEEIAQRKAEAAKRKQYASIQPFLNRTKIAIQDSMPHCGFITESNVPESELNDRLKLALKSPTDDASCKGIEDMILCLVSKHEPESDKKKKNLNDESEKPSTKTYLGISLYVPSKFGDEKYIEMLNSVVPEPVDGDFEVYSSISLSDSNISSRVIKSKYPIKAADLAIQNFVASVRALGIMPEEDDDDEVLDLEAAGIEW